MSTNTNTNTNYPKTLAEAQAKGWSYAGWAWTRGYVSRKGHRNANEIRTIPAGGSRKGLIYFLAPSWDSTQFCQRVYLAAPEV